MATFDQDRATRLNQAYASPGSVSSGNASSILAAKGGANAGFVQQQQQFAKKQALQRALQALRQKPRRPSLLDQYVRQQSLSRKRPNSGVMRKPPRPSVTGGTPAPYDGPRY